MTHVSTLPTVPKGTLGNGGGSALFLLYMLIISHGSHARDSHPGSNILMVICLLNVASSLLTMLLRVYRL